MDLGFCSSDAATTCGEKSVPSASYSTAFQPSPAEGEAGHRTAGPFRQPAWPGHGAIIAGAGDRSVTSSMLVVITRRCIPSVTKTS